MSIGIYGHLSQKKAKEECGFQEKCTSLKRAFFSKKCITRAFFIFFFFLNNIKGMKEGSKLRKNNYTLESLKNW